MRSRLPKRPPRPTFEVQDVVHHLLWSREVGITERAAAFELALELPYLRGDFEARLAPKHYKKQMRALQARADDAGPMSTALFSALAKLRLGDLCRRGCGVPHRSLRRPEAA